MAPMLLTVATELQDAPHTLKRNTSTAAAMQSEAEPLPAPRCQVCFDECVAEDGQTVTQFCGATCPAVLCSGCLAEHVRVSVEAAFPGVLPKVKCPICLVPVNKSKWEAIAKDAVVAAYAAACRSACSFQSPCCHDTGYTHLPREFDATDLPHKYIQPATLSLVPSLKRKLEPLRELVRRFCHHKVASKAVVLYIEDTFGRHVTIETQHLIVEHVLPRILDEERRATLLLSYHAKYKAVTTRCCGYSVCFNCKRLTSNHAHGDTDADACDVGVLTSDNIVECRSCHVTMVKVEGCSAVRCWCGFSMDWEHEVRLRDRYVKKLLPVDPFDVELCRTWEAWHAQILRYVRDELLPTRLALRLSRIDQQLAGLPSFRKSMLTVVEKYVWRRRFARLLPEFKQEMAVVRMRVLAKRLAKRAPFVEAMRRAKWRTRWKRVAKAVRAKQFWLAYYTENPVERHEIKKEEMAMLLPAFF